MTRVGVYDLDRRLVSEHAVLADGTLDPPASIPAGYMVLALAEESGTVATVVRAMTATRIL